MVIDHESLINHSSFLQEIEITGRVTVGAGERILAISDLAGSAQFTKTT